MKHLNSHSGANFKAISKRTSSSHFVVQTLSSEARNRISTKWSLNSKITTFFLFLPSITTTQCLAYKLLQSWNIRKPVLASFDRFRWIVFCHQYNVSPVVIITIISRMFAIQFVYVHRIEPSISGFGWIGNQHITQMTLNDMDVTKIKIAHKTKNGKNE